jgi:malonyl-CoA/methylmalonyl-CoA synthetase
MAGSHVIMLDRFSPETVLVVLSRKQRDRACTLFMAVPAMYSKLMENLGEGIPNLEHIRLWALGSAPLLAKDFGKIKEVFGKEPVEREGMSEMGMNFSNPLRGIRKPGSIGHAPAGPSGEDYQPRDISGCSTWPGRGNLA